MRYVSIAVIVAGSAGLALLAACAPYEAQVGRADYTAYCAACHGPSGRGDGPAAADLAAAPSDLSLLAARNGGVFPQLEVMAQIDGYTREGVKMPEFGEILAEGRTVLVETEPGVMTPTPERLVALAAYLETLQRVPAD